MPKYTPGNWYTLIRNGKVSIWSIYRKRDYEVCQVGNISDDKRVMLDANLISKAKDLLDIAKEYQKTLDFIVKIAESNIESLKLRFPDVDYTDPNNAHTSALINQKKEYNQVTNIINIAESNNNVV